LCPSCTVCPRDCPLPACPDKQADRQKKNSASGIQLLRCSAFPPPPHSLPFLLSFSVTGHEILSCQLLRVQSAGSFFAFLPFLPSFLPSFLSQTPKDVCSKTKKRGLQQQVRDKSPLVRGRQRGIGFLSFTLTPKNAEFSYWI
jgi:hypothetical protein